MPQTLCKEIGKHIYYSFIAPILVLFMVYYFSYYDKIIENIRLVLSIQLLVCICLLVLYVLNTIYLLTRISKHRRCLKKKNNYQISSEINVENHIVQGIIIDEDENNRLHPSEIVCNVNYII